MKEYGSKYRKADAIMENKLEELRKTGIVPVVVIDDAKDALMLGKALIDGGIACAEVTFRTEAAEEAIRILSENYPDMLVGAGTILTIEQVIRAVNAGAKFIVSPGINPKVVEYCVNNDILIIPGTANPANVETALEYNLKVVKFFPAEQAGGLNYIKAISAPYAGVVFMPTGGINQDNVSEYLKFDRIIACGGSWMVKKDLIKESKFNEITRLTKEATEIVKRIRG